jgi:hypothetical protein
MGAVAAIRNLATHRPEEPDEQVALEQLAALSSLARWVDAAASSRLSDGVAPPIRPHLAPQPVQLGDGDPKLSERDPGVHYLSLGAGDSCTGCFGPTTRRGPGPGVRAGAGFGNGGRGRIGPVTRLGPGAFQPPPAAVNQCAARAERAAMR